MISITDGQLFLNLDAFNSGRRPAVDSGLSVSRVGSAAQSSAMKHVSSSLKLELASYYELLSFSQFSTDLDKETRRIINRGERLVELLKQANTTTLNHEETVLSLFLSKYDYIDQLLVNDVSKFEINMQKTFKALHPDILEEIKTSRDLSLEKIYKIKVVMNELLPNHLEETERTKLN